MNNFINKKYLLIQKLIFTFETIYWH